MLNQALRLKGAGTVSRLEILQLNKSAWIFSCVNNNRALPGETQNPSYYTMHNNITFTAMSKVCVRWYKNFYHQGNVMVLQNKSMRPDQSNTKKSIIYWF